MKLFNKIAILSAGAAMAIGAGIGLVISGVNANVAKAESPVSMDFSAQGYGNAQEITSVELDSNITVSFNKGTGTNTPKYYTSGTAIRIYGGGCMTVAAAPGINITEITFTFGSSDGTNEITANVGSYEAPKWTGSSNSVVLTVGGSSGNRRVKGISVTYGGTATTELSGVNLTPTFKVVKKGGTTQLNASPIPSNCDGSLSYSWSSDATSVATVSNGVVTGVDVGVANITATICDTENDIEKSAVGKIIVCDHAGTSEDPLSVSDAVLIADTVGGTATDEQYYVTGKVSNVSISSGQATFKISDATSSLTCYKMYDANGAKNLTNTDVKNGDTAVVLGAIFTYHAGEADAVAEMQYGKVISSVSDTTLTSVEIRGSITKSVDVGDAFDLSELTVYAIYSDGSEMDITAQATLTSDPATATVAGEVTISVTASFESVVSASREFTVTVNAISADAKKVDFVIADYAAANSWENGQKYATVENQYVSVGTSIEGTNTTKYYSANQDWRFYYSEEADVVFTAKTGYTLKSITINYNNKDGAYLVDEASQTFETGSTVQTTNSTYRFTVGGTKGNVQITRMIIWLTATGSTTPTAASVAANIKTLAGGWNNNVQTGECAAHYAAAKAAILGLSAEELATFQDSNDADIASARATYVYWCTINGDEHPYEGEIVSSTRTVETNNSSSIIVAIAAIASVSVLGAAMFFRKKKVTE